MQDAISDRYDAWTAWHAYVLHAKSLNDEQSLYDAIVIDQASSQVAVNAVLVTDAARALCALKFPEYVVDMILASSVNEEIDHFGFRIHAPMDVYFELLADWVDLLGWSLKGTKRFAPSARFQQRIGTTAEMAQIWLETPEGQVEIELFDIHSPSGGELSALSAEARRFFETGDPLPPSACWRPFAVDDIWHCGIRLRHVSDVQIVHEALAKLVGSRHDLALRNEDVVINRWHGSHHTKLANVLDHVEVEILAYISDWDA